MADDDDFEDEEFEEEEEEEEEEEDIPIILAAFEGDLAKVEQLIAEGADPRVAYQNGVTALMWASVRGHLDVVKLLLQDERVDPAAANNDGLTALMSASWFGHLDVVKLLLLHPRTDPTAIETGDWRFGYTAIKFAVEHKRLPVVEHLLSDLRVVRALRKEDGVPPAAIKLALARRAWERRRVIVCARVLYWESLGYK